MIYRPYEYQQRAIDFILRNRVCLLALDMGLGKSSITLTAIQELMDEGEVNRALVVAPKKVAETTWTSEAAKWRHLQGLRVVKVMGTERQRLAALSTPADVFVIGRDSFVWLVGIYNAELPFDFLVIDELTGFKSPTSLRFKAMRMARPGFERVVGLTGTPAPNGLIDMWGQIYCLDMGERLGKSVSRYRETYFDLYRRNNIILRCDAKQGSDRRIRDKIADICLTMQSKDYLQLPAMIEHTVLIELPRQVKTAYVQFERDKVLEFAREQEGKQSNVIANSAVGLMNKLAQFANGAVYDEDGNAVDVHDEKADKLAEIVEAANCGVLVFFQFRHDIPKIRRKLAGYRVEVYEGEKQLIDWNLKKIDVLLAHPASTAYGLNMQQGGHYIVWFGLTWNLELYLQANARLHRQGQTMPVTVYRLLTAETVDERIAAALSAKDRTQSAMLSALSELVQKHTVTSV